MARAAQWPPSLRSWPEYEGKLTIAKVNVDDEQRWAGQYGIMAIPTMLVFKKGQIVQRIQGAAPKPKLKQVFDDALVTKASA